jgi:hypothetical protein
VDMAVTLPDARIELGDWTLAEFANDSPELLANGDVRYVLRYTLEPNLPGTYTLPRLLVTAGERRVETTATEIEVRGIIEAPHKAQLRALAEEPAAESAHPWPHVALVVALFLAGLWCAVRKRKPLEPSPQKQALAAIESATDAEELAAALRCWAPHLLPRLDTYRFRQADPMDLGELQCELRQELQTHEMESGQEGG